MNDDEQCAFGDELPCKACDEDCVRPHEFTVDEYCAPPFLECVYTELNGVRCGLPPDHSIHQQTLAIAE